MVSINEILRLKNLDVLKLQAGSGGLGRKVIRAGFIDHESVENLAQDNIANEMVFSNLPMIKGHPEQIVDYVRILIASETACFILKKTLFDAFPQEAIDLAERNDYPLFLLEDIYIDKLILDIHSLIDDRHQLEKKAELIRKIMEGKLTPYDIRSRAHDLNYFFEPMVTVYSIVKTASNKMYFDLELAQKRLGQNALILPYGKTYIAVMTDKTEVPHKKQLAQKLGLKKKNFRIGVSGNCHEIGMLRQLIEESRIALQYAQYTNVLLESYKDIGIYQMLIPMISAGLPIHFYGDTIDKIKAYDKTHHSNLLDTCIAYIHADGNMKKTAEVLFQHVNTVRFRIRKIMEIIDDGQPMGGTYENLAMVVRLYELGEKAAKIAPL